MSKLVKFSIITLILVFSVILISNFVLAAGCCYIEAQAECRDNFPSTESDCLHDSYGNIVPGNKYNSSCDIIPECKEVCCCDNLGQAIYDIMGVCKVSGFSWVETTE